MANTLLESMLDDYGAATLQERENALKEIMQEVVLSGLARAGFFRHAAFYGGTALRIFYGLDRFSEDLDFSLTEPDSDFDLMNYCSQVEKEAAAFGMHMDIKEKQKTKQSAVRSAFMKANTKEHIVMFYGDEAASSVPKNKRINIKIEVDTDPPAGASFEHRYRLVPAPYEIRLYDAPSLFAGKLHAVLCRNWKTRVKGRDLYDHVFFLSKNTAVNIDHLKMRLVQSSVISEDENFGIPELKKMLRERFAAIDYDQAKADVRPFLRDASQLDLWCEDFFVQISEGIRVPE